MEANRIPQKSILGPWWVPIRPWFYSAWLAYELTIRFYDYGLAVYHYFLEFENHLGEFGAQALALFCGIAVFLICTSYLTLAGCVLLFKFFSTRNESGNSTEEKFKYYF
ncbi:hypothetical protein KFE98_10570 [bacterium SCSIO 12741]|nr:hypothetical protein KFE98_10570 [bacterium SCSIO 12741]